jgi:hypothetical protein
MMAGSNNELRNYNSNNTKPIYPANIKVHKNGINTINLLASNHTTSYHEKGIKPLLFYYQRDQITGRIIQN